MFRLVPSSIAAVVPAPNKVGPSPFLLQGYADFCARRGRVTGDPVVLAVLPPEGDGEVPLGWLVGVLTQGRLDALPDRMYGFIRGVSNAPLDLDALLLRLRRDYGGKFTVNLPPEPMGGPYATSHRTTFTRYHAFDTFLLGAASEEEAWERLDRTGKQGVRRAEKEGLAVSCFTDSGAFMRYLSLHVAKSARKGSPMMSRTEMSRLVELFGDRLGVAIVSRGGAPLSAVLYLVDGAYAMLIDNASQPEHWHLHPNHLAVWHAVKHCLKQGATVVDYGFSAIDDRGSAVFKANLGAERYPVYAVMSS